MDRKAFSGEFDCGRHDVAGRHRPEEPQGCQPGIDRRRNHPSMRAPWNSAVACSRDRIERCETRPSPDAGDGRRPPVRQTNEDRRNTAEVGHVGMDHVQRKARRHAGIDRIAARFENSKPCDSGQWMSGRYHVATPHQQWPFGRRIRHAHWHNLVSRGQAPCEDVLSSHWI